MSISHRFFGTLSSTENVEIFHLENKNGMYAEVIPYGAILVNLSVPDKDGKLREVVLGYDNLDSYRVNGCFFGATIGRCGNRTANASFTIDGEKYQLAANENENNLHSGPDGYEKKLWNVQPFNEDENSITFCRLSPDGENGFPGNFEISVTYTLTDDNELKISYNGVSDKKTVANLTNHSYFNLNGEGSGKILDHELMICADYFTPVTNKGIPTGVYQSVKGTPMDFTSWKKIGEEINLEYEQLLNTGGYDHNYVTNDYEKGKIRKIAAAYSELSGIMMETYTDCPCVQLYAGNFIIQEQGKNNHLYDRREGFCLETQVEPNASNEPAFHSPIIEAGEKYHTETIYRFSIK